MFKGGALFPAMTSLFLLGWLVFLPICRPALADESLPVLPTNWFITSSVAALPALRGLVPRHSDVVFSTRFKRENAVATAKKFGATRVEWVYASINDSEYLRSLKDSIGWVGGALNANVQTPKDEGVALDFDGNQLIAPWMRAWGSKWVTTTNPLARIRLIDWASSYVKVGVDSIQFDDPLLQLQSSDWGGDFSSATLSGFREFLQRYPDKEKLASLGIHDLNSFNYKEYLHKVHGIRNNADYLRSYRSLSTTPLWNQYLKESINSFFTELRHHLDNTASRHIPLSMNLTMIDRPSDLSQQFFLTKHVDYIIAETPIKDAADMHVRAATLRALGLGYIPSPVPSSIAEGRRFISTFYALGANPLVPWDVFVYKGANVEPARYFGKFEEFGDLYRFVRRYPQLFDGWEATPAVGVVIPIDKYRENETMTLVRKLVSNRVPFAFVLTGGSEIKYTLDEQKLRHFGVTMTPNPDNDFSKVDLDKLHSIKNVKMGSTKMSETAIASLSPFFQTENSDKLTLIPRGHENQNRRNELVIHVIAEREQINDAKMFCMRSFGIKSSVLSGKQPKRMTWYGVDTVPQEVKWDKVPQGFKIKLPSCGAWGIIHMELTN